MKNLGRALTAIFGALKRTPNQRTDEITPRQRAPHDRQPVDQQRLFAIKRKAAKRGYR